MPLVILPQLLKHRTDTSLASVTAHPCAALRVKYKEARCCYESGLKLVETSLLISSPNKIDTLMGKQLHGGRNFGKPADKATVIVAKA